MNRRSPLTLRVAVLALLACGPASCSFLVSPSEVHDTGGETTASDGTVDRPASDGTVQDMTGTRSPVTQPFRRASIWNLPLGAGATLVPAGLTGVQAITASPAILVLTPAAPLTAVHYNADGWSGKSRCDTSGSVLLSAPIPANFVVPGATPSYIPSNPAALLLADGRTVKQNQPFTRCVAGQDASTQYAFPDADLLGWGVEGAHGGSGLSSIGGTLRRGELVPNGHIRHVLKLVLSPGAFLSATSPGYRWPAVQADANWQTLYQGQVPALRMGALLALPPTVVLSGWLESEPGRIVARALQDYGAYAVNGEGGSRTCGLVVEVGPEGSVAEAFQLDWGHAMDQIGTAWGRDLVKIFAALAVVDNWDQALHGQVAASAGALGAGGGAARVSWAPPL